MIVSRPHWRALVHRHLTVGTATFRSREHRDGTLWLHLGQATVVYAIAPTSITVPPDVTAVHDREGHALSVRPGEAMEVTGRPANLSR